MVLVQFQSTFLSFYTDKKAHTFTQKWKNTHGWKQGIDCVAEGRAQSVRAQKHSMADKGSIYQE